MLVDTPVGVISVETESTKSVEPFSTIACKVIGQIERRAITVDIGTTLAIEDGAAYALSAGADRYIAIAIIVGKYALVLIEIRIGVIAIYGVANGASAVSTWICVLRKLVRAGIAIAISVVYPEVGLFELPSGAHRESAAGNTDRLAGVIREGGIQGERVGIDGGIAGIHAVYGGDRAGTVRRQAPIATGRDAAGVRPCQSYGVLAASGIPDYECRVVSRVMGVLNGPTRFVFEVRSLGRMRDAPERSERAAVIVLYEMIRAIDDPSLRR